MRRSSESLKSGLAFRMMKRLKERRVKWRKKENLMQRARRQEEGRDVYSQRLKESRKSKSTSFQGSVDKPKKLATRAHHPLTTTL